MWFILSMAEIHSIVLCVAWYTSSALKYSFSKQFLSLSPLPITLSFLECLFTVAFTFFAIKAKHYNERTTTTYNVEDRECKGTSTTGTSSSTTSLGDGSSSADEGVNEGEGSGGGTASEGGGSDWRGWLFLALPSWPVVYVLLPITLATVFGHVLTQVSLEFIPVSFTHTVKSLSPLFTMVLSYLMCQERFTVRMVISIIPIMLGVILSSAVELNFHIIGVITALLSSFCFCFTNIYSKVIVDRRDLDFFHLLIYNNIGSTVILFIIATVTEWSSIGDFTNAHLVSLSGRAYQLIFAIGFFHFLQSITAISFLVTVSPLSYSVANTFKRVFVILWSIFYFGNVVSYLNYTGIFISLLGVLLYNQASTQHKTTIKIMGKTKENHNRNGVVLFL